jgi:hypothetical protein
MPYPIVLDSSSRLSTSSSSSDYTIKLQYPTHLRRIRFKKIKFNFSWLPIASPNNTLTFNDGVGNFTATIGTPSTFAGNDIATALQTGLNAAGSAVTFTVTYSGSTGLFTIAATGNFTLLFATTNNWIYKILGFNNDDTTYTGANTYTSTNVAQCLGFDYVIVKSSALLVGANEDSRAYYSTTSPYGDTLLANSKNVFITAPVTSDYLGTNYFDQNNFSREIEYKLNSDKTSQNVLTEIDIQLCEPWTDRPILMRGINWLLELEAE